MTIVCIAWGSLIWRPGTLPIDGDWQLDGPALPVEFARQSRDNRITLVLCKGVPTVTTLWVSLDVSTLDAAKEALAAREDIRTANIATSIGYWSPVKQSGGTIATHVAAWAGARKIDGAVWTALKPRIGGIQRMPTVAEVLTHLAGLNEAERIAAEEYVRRAPPQIATAYRAAISETLGW